MKIKKKNLVMIVVVFVILLLSSIMMFKLLSPEEKVVGIGDTIRVDYTGTFEDGTQFDSSVDRQPLKFVVGAGQTIPGFDNGVMGMKIGEERDVKIQPNDAYGDVNPEAIREISRDQINTDEKIEIGMLITLTTGIGQELPGRVTKISNETLTVDMNHPLAGRVLNFNIKLIEIVS